MLQQGHVLSFGAIAGFFKEELSLIDRGENAMKSNRVQNLTFDGDVLIIRGKVQASMRDRIYSLDITLDAERNIQDATCTCPRGQFLCHHMAALCLFARDNVSVTDMQCQWNAPKRKSDEIQTIEELYPSKAHVAINRDPTEEETAKFLHTLEEYGGAVGFSWLLKPDPNSEAMIAPDIEEMIFSSAYLESANKEQFLFDSLAASTAKIAEIQMRTVGQSSNHHWLTIRKNRVTASNFGPVISAVRRVQEKTSRKYPVSLFKRLTESYSLEGAKAIQWGRIHETTAIEEFSSATKKEVIPSGIWLHSCGFLGGSPDGLVSTNAIIEVKCPYKWREKILLEELHKDRSYIIWMNEEGETIVNKSHDYYHQIQGLLELTGRELCYLVVWSPQQTIIHEIYKETEWSSNIDVLKQFYVNSYIPYITNSLDY